MGWSSPDSWLTRLFSGDPLAILISFVVTLSLPALLHWYFYTTSPKTNQTPTFLLLGPSNAGKTSLITLLQSRFSASGGSTTDPNGTAPPAPTVPASQTRTSQISSNTSLLLPGTIPLGSNKYRSENDFEVSEAKTRATKYVLIDTPGHGKLRNEHALSHLSNPAIRGVIYMVDSAALDSSTDSDSTSGEDATRDAATYLHDVLLALQRRKLKSKKPKGDPDMHVLIAANKQDLFTALPIGAIRSKLQDEIEKVRKSRSRGIKSVDTHPDQDEEDEDNVLGGLGEDKFTFRVMAEEYGIVVQVAAGAVRGEDAADRVRPWEQWIGSCL